MQLGISLMSNSIDQIYDEIILDHCKNPRNNRKIHKPNIICKAVNSFCGDEVNIEIKLSSKKIITLTGSKSLGCAINKASSSMLSEVLYGKSIKEVFNLYNIFNCMMKENTVPKKASGQLGYLKNLKIIKKNPIRIKCCLLPWTALINEIEKI